MDFGPWLPDLLPYNHAGLVTARNVYASPNGYKPFRGLSAITAALSVDWKGGGSFIGLDGTTIMLAGTNSGLYSYSAGAWSSEYAGSYTANWQFAQFGAFVIGVNGGAPVKYTISTSTGAVLGGTPPTSTMVAIVRDFVFMAGNPAALSTVYWSANNNAEGWTSGTGESDTQELPDGGPVTGLAGGEYGLAFQENAIHRFSYVGVPLIFQRDKISSGIGCLASGSVTQFGRMVFFLSGRGFYSIVDGELNPIGQNKVDETFWATYSRSDVQNNIRATIDPKRALVIWSMPDRLWVYNWVLDRWTDAYIPGLTGVSTAMSAGVGLESLDAAYPSGLDSIPYSLDDPIFAGGDPMITFIKSDKIIYSFGGASTLDATLQFAKLEPTPGRKSRIRRARLNSDATSGVVLTINRSDRLGDAQTAITSSVLTANGYMPIRATGRYIQPSVNFTTSATWTYAQGLSMDISAGGGA